MFRNLFRILAIILVIAFARYLFHLVRRAFSESMSASRTGGGTRSREELYRDPVCGTYVADGALTVTKAGVTHHFCSPACRDKFKAA